MRVLLVEDDQRYLETLVPALSELGVTATVVRTAAEARAQFNEFFDFVFLDLKLPAEEGDAAQVETGHALLQELRESVPGTPVAILTASSTEDFARKLVRRAEQQDLFGTRRQAPVIQLWSKSELPEFLASIKSDSEEVRAVDGIELAAGMHDVRLKKSEKRILRLFVRRRKGSSASIAPITEGLSGSKALRLVVRLDSGQRQTVFAKVSKIGAVEDEAARFNVHATRLSVGTYPTFIERLRFGAGRTGGVFFSFAEEFAQDLFKFSVTTPDKAHKTVHELRRRMEQWHKSDIQESVSVGSIRRLRVSDADAAPLIAKVGVQGLAELEPLALQATKSTMHGDLHAGNVLVDGSGQPLLIDFEDSGPGPAAMDPVSLEFSFYCHPQSPIKPDVWMSRADNWAKIDKYVENVPCGPLIKACREWAFAVGGNREVLACAFAYLVQQLRYPAANIPLITKLLVAVRKALLSTYEE